MKKYVVVKEWKHSYYGAKYSTWKMKVYDFIKSKGDVGANRREIAEAVNLNVGRISSYLAELKREGWVKRLGDSVDQKDLPPEESVLFAMNALEVALVSKATRDGVTPQLEKEFAVYQKVKSRVLGAGTTPEEARTALRMSLVRLVQMVV